MGGPPHLVIGRGGDCAQFRARDGPPDGGVEVGCAAALRFDRAEVLHLPAHTPAGVLPEPIHDLREVDGVAGGAPVVVAVRVDRGPVGVHPPVAVEGQGEERGGPVAARVGAAEGAVLDRAAGQVGCVLPPPGGPLAHPPFPVERGEPAGDTHPAELVVDHGHGLADGLALVVVVVVAGGQVGGVQLGPAWRASASAPRSEPDGRVSARGRGASPPGTASCAAAAASPRRAGTGPPAGTRRAPARPRPGRW